MLDSEGKVIQGEFDKLWEPLRVMARCSPTDKLTIVKGLLLPTFQTPPLIVVSRVNVMPYTT